MRVEIFILSKSEIIQNIFYFLCRFKNFIYFAAAIQKKHTRFIQIWKCVYFRTVEIQFSIFIFQFHFHLIINQFQFSLINLTDKEKCDMEILWILKADQKRLIHFCFQKMLDFSYIFLVFRVNIYRNKRSHRQILVRKP